MRVAAIQTISTPSLSENLQRTAELLALAAQAGAELAVLPEYFVLMGLNDAAKLQIAEDDGAGPMQDWLAQQARTHGLWLVGGSVPLRVPGDAQRVFNSCLVHAPSGARVARYDKIHLFRFATEHEAYDEWSCCSAATRRCALTCPAVMATAGAWACRFAMTCAFPSCTGGMQPLAPI